MKLNSTGILLGLLIMIGCIFTTSIIVDGIKNIQKKNYKNIYIDIVHEDQQFTKQIQAKYSGIVIPRDSENIHDIKVIIDGQEYVVPYGYEMLPTDINLGDTVDVLITYHVIYIIRIDNKITATTIDSVELEI